MEVRPSGSVTSLSEVQSWKVWRPMEVRPSGSVTELSEAQP